MIADSVLIGRSTRAYTAWESCVKIMPGDGGSPLNLMLTLTVPSGSSDVVMSTCPPEANRYRVVIVCLVMSE